jgi:hypothetical protein
MTLARDRGPSVCGSGRSLAPIWRAADKVVDSRTLQTLASARTRIERDFDLDVIARLKASTDRDVTVGGSALAGEAIAAGLVDECHLFLNPVVVGGGKQRCRRMFASSLPAWAALRAPLPKRCRSPPLRPAHLTDVRTPDLTRPRAAIALRVISGGYQARGAYELRSNPREYPSPMPSKNSAA